MNDRLHDKICDLHNIAYALLCLHNQDTDDDSVHHQTEDMLLRQLLNQIADLKFGGDLVEAAE